MLRALFLSIVICFAVPLAACYNDSDIQSYEEEFESEYLQQGAPAEEEVPSGIALFLRDAVVNVIFGVGLFFVLVFAVRGDLRVVHRS